MTAPSMLHSFVWIQMMLHSSHPFQVVLNSGLTKAAGEHGMEISTREPSSTRTMVCYVGEGHWKKALDELTQRGEPANVGAMGAPRFRSAEQPASSLHRAAQLASDAHSAAHAKHTEYMMFLQSTLYEFYDIWRSMNEPKKVRASWSSLEQSDAHVGSDCPRCCFPQLPL